MFFSLHGLGNPLTWQCKCKLIDIAACSWKWVRSARGLCKLPCILRHKKLTFPANFPRWDRRPWGQTVPRKSNASRANRNFPLANIFGMFSSEFRALSSAATRRCLFFLKTWLRIIFVKCRSDGEEYKKTVNVCIRKSSTLLYWLWKSEYYSRRCVFFEEAEIKSKVQCFLLPCQV